MRTISCHMSRHHKPYDPNNRNIQILPCTVLGEDNGSLESAVLSLNNAGFQQSIFEDPHATVRYIEQYKIVTFPVNGYDAASVTAQAHKLMTVIGQNRLTDLYLASRMFSPECLDILGTILDDSVTLILPGPIDSGHVIPRNHIFFNMDSNS